MKKICFCFLPAISLFLALIAYSLPSYGQLPPRPDIFSTNVAGNPPTIDGDPSEWAGYTPNLDLKNDDGYPIETFVYFLNDATYLYVLVDAVEDMTNGPGCDEVLLEFNSFPTTDFEFGTSGSGTVTDPDPLPTGSQVSIGFGPSVNNSNPHRIYEMRIPRSYIGAGSGAVIDFSSPAVKAICATASLPYDGGGGEEGPSDNIYPSWLDQSDINTYARLHFDDPAAIPTLNEWGMIIFIVIGGLGSLYFLKRRQQTR